MTAPKQPENIQQVILELQKANPVLAKDKVGYQKAKYADLVQVNEVVLKLLNDLQTIWTCLPTVVDDVFALHYSLLHVPSDTAVKGVWPLPKSDNQQQLGSAVTYGRRYALLAVTGVVAEGDDDDGAATTGDRTVQRRPVARPAPRTVGEAADRPTVARARPAGPPLPGEAAMITDAQVGAVNTLLTKLGIKADADRHSKISELIGEPVESTKQLTQAEARSVYTKLQELVEAEKPRTHGSGPPRED